MDDGAPGRVFLEDQGFTPAQIEELDVGAATELVIYASPDRVDAVRAAVVAAAGEAAVGGAQTVPDRDWSEEWKTGLRAVEQLLATEAADELALMMME